MPRPPYPITTVSAIWLPSEGNRCGRESGPVHASVWPKSVIIWRKSGRGTGYILVQKLALLLLSLPRAAVRILMVTDLQWLTLHVAHLPLEINPLSVPVDSLVDTLQ